MTISARIKQNWSKIYHTMIDSLISLGLSPTEALIYKTLLEVGPCFVAPLVRQTKKHRQIVYNALENLEKKSLVGVSKRNGKNFYAISDPQRFLISVKQKEVLAEQVVKKIERYLEHDQEQVDVFSGSDSYSDGLADFRLKASETGEYIVIGGEPKEWYEFTRPFFKEHVEEVKKLKRQGISIFILFFEKERSSAKEYILPHVGNPYVCKIANEQYRLPHTAWLAGEYVYILTPASDPLVVRIKSKPFANHYREYFGDVWEKSNLLK